MTSSSDSNFKHNYQTHLKHLKLKGLQPKTIEAYARAIRRIGAYFDYQINDLCEQQLTDYFADLLDSHSRSAVKLDLYGLKFYYTHVLHKPWVNIDLIKPPKVQRLPDIVTIEEAKRLFMATHGSVTGCSISPSTALACAWAKAYVFRSAILTLTVSAFICATPRATKTVSFLYRMQPLLCCAASGGSTVIRCCCFPIAMAI